MNDDEELENQMPEDDVFEEGGMDDLSDDMSGSAEDFDGEYGAEEGFYDEDAEAGEGEEWDSYDEDFAEGEDAAAGPKKKKKKGSFEKMIIAGAVVVGGVVMMMQMGLLGGGQPAPTQPAQGQAQQQQQQVQAQQAAATPVKAPETQRDVIYGANLQDEQAQKKNEDTGPKTGFMNDPAVMQSVKDQAERAFYGDDFTFEKESGVSRKDQESDSPATGDGDSSLSVDVVKGTPPMPAPIKTEMDLDGPLTPMPKAEEEAPASFSGGFEERVPRIPDGDKAASPSLPKAADIMKDKEAQDTMASAVRVDETSDKATADAAQAGAISSDQFEALNSKLDMIFDRLDSVELEVASLKDLARNGGGVDSKIMADLQKTVKSLEGKVGTLSKEQKKQETATTSRAVSTTRSVPSPERSYTPPSVKTGTSATPKWVLKAAQPGKAWVMREGGNDMLSVSVGESLEGIGRIESVEYADNQWVVRGTKGKITQ